MRIAANYRRKHLASSSARNYREARRFQEEARRRARGAKPRDFKNRRSVIDAIEGTRRRWALLEQLQHYDNGELTSVALKAGVSRRALYRYRYGESSSVRIDVADRLAVAMGTTSSLVWGDVW